jgi:hypothetical protein
MVLKQLLMKFAKALLEPNRINQSYFAEDEVDEI